MEKPISFAVSCKHLDTIKANQGRVAKWGTRRTILRVDGNHFPIIKEVGGPAPRGVICFIPVHSQERVSAECQSIIDVAYGEQESTPLPISQPVL